LTYLIGLVQLSKLNYCSRSVGMTIKFVNYFYIQWYIGGTERREAMSGLEALTVNNFRVVTI